MIRIGSPRTPSETKMLLLGSGELGKEVAIEAQRFGVAIVAVDRYANAPAMQVAHRSHVIAMTDPDELRRVVLEEQDLSEFALHVRAILGLPIGPIRQHGPSASHVILGEGHSDSPRYEIDERVLLEPDTSLRLFGKPQLRGQRRLGVALARGASTDEARAKAMRVAEAVRVL
jgi:formate-dependent phosphoribosylglycinamide formyltransferase (GAR transformylase)